MELNSLCSQECLQNLGSEIPQKEEDSQGYVLGDPGCAKRPFPERMQAGLVPPSKPTSLPVRVALCQLWTIDEKETGRKAHREGMAEHEPNMLPSKRS